MQTGINLQELATKIMDMEVQKKDYIATTDALWMDAEGDGVNIEMKGIGKFNVSDIAHNQISDKLQIPRTYYNRLLSKHSDLLATNVNALWAREPEKRMVRTLQSEKPTIRAILSDRFTTTKDNMVVSEAVLPVLFQESEKNGLQVKSTELTEKRMYIQCVYPKFSAEIKPGDIVQSGIVISNSEVGLGAFSIEMLIYRLVCSNGMIRPASIRQHHVGRRIDTNEEINQDFYRRETILADQTAFRMKIADTVRHSFNKEQFDKEILKLQEAANDTFRIRKSEKIVEEVTKRFAISEDDGGSILESLIEGKDFSRWGLANAITSQAHGAKTYDRSIEFERLGSKIIDLSASEWKEVQKEKMN